MKLCLPKNLLIEDFFVKFKPITKQTCLLKKRRRKRKMKSSRIAQFFLLINLVLIPMLNISSIECESQTFVFSDDFSTDSGMWDFLGSAYRDSVNQYLVLTEPIDWISGVVFFKISFTGAFTANFSYKAGGGSGADGFVIFFYKQKYSSFSYGSTLGFNDKYDNGSYKIIPGYGIEFDNWGNIEQPGMTEHADPSANHIALIKDHTGNHLIYVNDSRTEDNVWHNVGQSVKFNSSTSGGLSPYTYQWYLNEAPISGANTTSWTFTPTTGGTYYVYLKVTDVVGNTAQSETARIMVTTVPVGGYSISIQPSIKVKLAASYIILLIILTAIFIIIKQKTEKY